MDIISIIKKIEREFSANKYKDGGQKFIKEII